MKLNQTRLAGPGSQPTGYFYADCLAMYTNPGGTTLQDGDNSLDWALRDVSGNPLYVNYNIPYQMVADPLNPYWRGRMLSWILDQLKDKYAGIELDDFNITLDTLANAAGAVTTPMLNGVLATPTTWADAMNDFGNFMEAEIHRAFPKAFIIHNTPWFRVPSNSLPWLDPQAQASWKSADYVMREGGFGGDTGLTGGTGFWSLNSLFQWVDAIHAVGKGVHVLETNAAIDPTYCIALALLTTNGKDLWEQRGWTSAPPTWAFNDFGTAGPRSRTAGGLWTRQFEKALVLVNEPGAPPVSVGTTTLGSSQGMVIQF